MTTRNNDISLILTKAKKQGWLPDISSSEVDALEAEALVSFKNDKSFSDIYGVGNHTRKYRSLRYYGPDNVNITTGGPHSLDLLYAIPFWVNDTLAVDRLASEITTAGAAGCVIRMGIYNSNDSDMPDMLQVQSSAIDGTTTGVKEATIDVTLKPGLYWLAFVNQVATTSTRTLLSSVQMPPVAATSFLNGNGALGGQSYYKTGITGVLPDSWGGTDSVGSGVPKLMVRAK